eukprot:gene19474-biopygen8467
MRRRRRRHANKMGGACWTVGKTCFLHPYSQYSVPVQAFGSSGPSTLRRLCCEQVAVRSTAKRVFRSAVSPARPRRPAAPHRPAALPAARSATPRWCVSGEGADPPPVVGARPPAARLCPAGCCPRAPLTEPAVWRPRRTSWVPRPRMGTGRARRA